MYLQTCIIKCVQQLQTAMMQVDFEFCPMIRNSFVMHLYALLDAYFQHTKDVFDNKIQVSQNNMKRC